MSGASLSTGDSKLLRNISTNLFLFYQTKSVLGVICSEKLKLISSLMRSDNLVRHFSID